jgi:hypothetical protein
MIRPWALILVLVLLPWLVVPAQVPVPFNSKDDRFMVFANGRFEKLEPRPPRQVIAQDGRLVYLDHDGRLRVFHAEGRRLFQLEASPPDAIGHSRHRLAWTRGDTLKTVAGGKAKVLTTGVERFQVSDSLIVYHDSIAHELRAWYRGTFHTLADVEKGTAAPQ